MRTDPAGRRPGEWAALALLASAAVAAWAGLLRGLPGASAPMPGMADMPAMAAPGFLARAAMWSLMVPAMMLPAGSVGLGRRGAGGPATLASAAGYLAPWLAFALLAAAAEAALGGHVLPGGRWPGASALALIGAFQLSPWKRGALAACRSPGREAPRGGIGVAARAGAAYGARCVASCAPLMLVLPAAGRMRPAALAGLTGWILAEKSLPWGLGLARAGGAVLIVWGGLRAAGLA